MVIAESPALRKRHIYFYVTRSKLSLFSKDPHSLFFYLYHFFHHQLPKTQGVTFVSYPKSGRTWIEQLLAQAVRMKYGITEPALEHYEHLCRVQNDLPSVKFTHAGSSWEAFPIYDQDELRRISPDRFAKGKTFFLYRDPRDVLVSAFYHIKHRNKVEHLTRREMIINRVFGLRKLLRFMNVWHQFCENQRGYLIIRYEDLQANTLREFRQLCGHIGLAIEDDILARAVEACRFDNMKKKERQGAYRSPRLSATDADNPKTFKVRSGRMLQYLSFFSKEELEEIEKIICEESAGKFIHEPERYISEKSEDL